jgi:predicted kinase
MNHQPKLIILYGFAASGKTTIARRYIDSHPLSMMIEGDEIINMMGDWRSHEKEARNLVYKHTCSILKNQLQAGHDVILPYLLTDVTKLDAFKKVAHEVGSPLHEIYLDGEKEQAIAKLLKRGVWGEEGSPLLTENDRPEIEELFDVMAREMSKVQNVAIIEAVEGDVEGAYQKFLKLISE